MFASFNDVFKGKSLREKKVPDVTLKYLSNNLPKGVKYVSDEHGNLTITSSDGSAVTFGGFNVTVTDEMRSVLGKQCSAAQIAKYAYNTQKKIEMNLKEDEFIFRIGGDELLILSKKEDAHICEERLLEIRLQFREEMKKKVPYPCDFSFGCVDIDKKENKTISEYLSLADKKMYHFKMQHYIDQRRPKYSNHIDKSGLDSRIFDAFSQTSINRYAYICNMETNVSRWSVQAVKDFDLPYEYMYDAGKIWEEHIHPDDCKEYEEDIEAVFSGKKECHDLTYRARLKNGKYIKCRCEGYVLRGRTAKEPNLFAGILTRVDEAVNYEER